MEKPSDGNAIALAGVAVGAACVFATLGAIADIWGNPWADIAFVLTVSAMGLAVANAFGVPIHGRVKATARQGPGRDTRTGDDAVPGGGTGLTADSEETVPAPGHDYGNRREGQPDEALRPVAAEIAVRWIRPDIDASLPLLEECLELRLAGGDLLSRRVTRGERPDETRTALPSREMVEEYRQALGKAMRCGGSCDEQAMSHVRRLSTSLQQVLMQAVPEAARRRLPQPVRGEHGSSPPSSSGSSTGSWNGTRGSSSPTRRSCGPAPQASPSGAGPCPRSGPNTGAGPATCSLPGRRRRCGARQPPKMS